MRTLLTTFAVTQKLLKKTMLENTLKKHAFLQNIVQIGLQMVSAKPHHFNALMS